jgi:presenilin-like A22 family membrane protease
MKHKIEITLILLFMFVLTQFIGLYVVSYYLKPENKLIFGLEPPEVKTESDYYSFFSLIVFAFIVAIVIFLVLIKIKIDFLIRLWFFSVVFIALSISFLSFFNWFKYALIFSLVLSFLFAFFKVYKRNILAHNFTEFFIYPGIAAVFVPIFNVYTIIILLVLISIYDAWAVWHSGIMQRMAKYQINKVRVFSGFFVPYLSKSLRQKIKKWKKKLTKKQLEKKKIKVNVAILGGGDVVFPIITAGVMFKFFGMFFALSVIIGATIGLSYLFFFAEKRKFYPAMPFITGGIFLGIILGYLITLI